MINLDLLLNNHSIEVQHELSEKFADMDWKKYRNLNPFLKLEFHLFLAFQELHGGEATHDILKRLDTDEKTYKVMLVNDSETLFFETMTDTANFLSDSASRVSKYYGREFKGYTVMKTHVTHILNRDGVILEELTHCN